MISFMFNLKTMAKVGNIIVTTGLSGKLGNLIVFRNRGWKTVSPIHPATWQKENNPTNGQR